MAPNMVVDLTPWLIMLVLTGFVVAIALRPLR